MSSIPKQSGVLIVTSSGGAGHILVAKQRELEEQKLGKVTVYKDVMKDLVLEKIGNHAVSSWNQAQKTGDIKKQENLVKKQPIADVLFFLPIFFNTLFSLFSMDPPPEKVVNTQVMGCRAMLLAMSLYNSIQKSRDSNWKDIKMEIWLTDFVSEKAVHFLNPLRSLSKSEKEMCTVFLPTDRKQDLEYFYRYTGFTEEKVVPLSDAQLPVKDIYKNTSVLQKYAPDTTQINELKISLNADQIKRAASIPNIKQATRGLNDACNSYTVPPGDVVYSLMMGSQPTEHVVKEFIQKMIEVSQASKNNARHFHFFVFCGKDADENGNLSLFKQVCESLKNRKDIPKELSIIPLPFQDPENIAKIMARSKKRFTRAGGATCFEHKAMRATMGQTPGKVYIVAEAALKDFEKRRVLKGDKDLLFRKIAVWEGANAVNLSHTIGAGVVCAQTFKEEICADFALEIAEQYPEEMAKTLKKTISTEEKLIDAVSKVFS